MTQRKAGAWWQIVQFGFRLLYHELAFTYDMVSYAVSLGQWRCWQRSALRYLPADDKGLILELAHGTGNLQLDLHRAGHRSVAFDYSAQMGRIARAKVRRYGIDGEFVRGKAQTLPFANESIGTIITTFPTSFIIEDSTLTEAYRVLRQDGRLIAVLNGQLTAHGPIARFLEWLYRITGQREHPKTSPTSYFEGYGFTVRADEVPCGQSKAQLVILRK